ncbi:response regulator [Pseudomonas plecoglossicida]|uniref:response regulator n=1 Tax=Pseudomonas plecoglossicida TaxID=70775 RepID=UPI00048AFB50|nr:response regulator [Pseudomonas plecoglossicida]GLR36248.1 hypothetical protein GCM10011247_16450 [Pseudomonas plecoglossicida]
MSSVLVVDNQPIVRDGLRALLERLGHQLLAEVDNGQDALLQCRLLRPQVVIVELLVPRLGGLDLLRRLRASHAGVRLLVFSAQEPGIYAARSLQAGADAYVSKAEAIEELRNALHAVSHGRSYFPSTATHPATPAVAPAGKDELAQLSARELSVLQLLSQGLSSKEIAEQLSLSYKTVSTYKVRLYQKLGVDSHFQLLEVARGHGLFAGQEPGRTTAEALDPALMREYGLLRGLLDSAPYPMFVRDLQGRLLMCNQRYLAHAGATFEQIQGHTLSEARWLPAGMRERAQNRLREAILREEPFVMETVIEHAGVPTSMFAWCTPFRDESGNQVAMLGGMRDLTERDRMLVSLRHEGAQARLQSTLKSSSLVAINNELRIGLERMQEAIHMARPATADSTLPALDALVVEIDRMGRSLDRINALASVERHELQTQAQAHQLGTLTEEILAPHRHQLALLDCTLDLGAGLRALARAWIDAHHYRKLLDCLFEQVRQGPLPAQLDLRVMTRILPRGWLCLSLELSPWYESTETDSAASWAFAELQHVLQVLHGSGRSIPAQSGMASTWHMELELPLALSDA